MWKEPLGNPSDDVRFLEYYHRGASRKAIEKRYKAYIQPEPAINDDVDFFFNKLNLKLPKEIEQAVKANISRWFEKLQHVTYFGKRSIKEELINAYKRLTPIVSPTEIMIQEVIPGGHVYSFCSFFKNKEVIAMWIGKKIREHPMGFGTGTFAESVYIPEIEELGTRILKAMNYYGISEIEFKRDQRDGKFKLLEINARTWLWHSLAIRCGVDFPYILYKDMIGEDITPITSFKTNIKWIHLYTDAWVSVKEIIGGNLKMRDYLKSLCGEKEFAVFSVNDPLPFICETLMLLYLRKTR